MRSEFPSPKKIQSGEKKKSKLKYSGKVLNQNFWFRREESVLKLFSQKFKVKKLQIETFRHIQRIASNWNAPTQIEICKNVLRRSVDTFNVIDQHTWPQELSGGSNMKKKKLEFQICFQKGLSEIEQTLKSSERK